MSLFPDMAQYRFKDRLCEGFKLRINILFCHLFYVQLIFLNVFGRTMFLFELLKLPETLPKIF